MRILSRAGFVAGALLLSGCVGTTNEAAMKPLLPDKALRLSASTTLPLEAVAAAALAYAVIDPLAPNWAIESRLLGGNRYSVALTMKRFVTGGDGEARRVFQREAERLVRINGAADFRIAAFEEGIESEVPVARRVARGIIELY
ncbi:MAG: hypothetical protein Q8L65_02245 [Burkholderiales bacterium]|nr:hypothetical protein [Burkholderiales bacterium]MDP2399273.1 hypothetical protein [Burkholderiales bacterium]